ncbi:MAG TPA: 3-dehydro-L-gulonate 2-dehydrogenase [Clostridiaceae bacterium]|nr:3-dehydro-L-gulonate 2-dehydrogenase [Clostridiaceae bacterium]
MNMRVPFDQLKAVIKQALLNVGLPEEKAEICARIHSETSLDGIESHGLNRVPRFVNYVKKGLVNVHAEPELIHARGLAENYDGNLGVGIINAMFCMDRAIALAKEHGLGIVTIRNTTHWMRGGTYAWQAAEQGMLAINWTNTESCMPMWGSTEISVGNNPFCMAIPDEKTPIVLDMALSLYSYGKLETYRLAGKQLPYPGGFDKNGNLTSDPGAIEESQRILPTGYWKGSGLAIALDMAAAILANGKTGLDMDAEGNGNCTSCCQVFIVIDPTIFSTKEEIEQMIKNRIDAVHNAKPEKEGDTVTVPGERSLAKRAYNLANGVPVNEQVWTRVQELAKKI